MFNCHADEVSAEDAIEFTRITLLGGTRDAAIGYPHVGLSSLIGTPASGFLKANDAEMKLNVRVSSLTRSEPDVFDVTLSNGSVFRCRNVISALDPSVASGVMPSSDAGFTALKNQLSRFEYSPIVAVHLWFEKPVMVEPVAAFVDLGLQWVFNDSALRNTSKPGSQHIVISLSGAYEWAKLDKKEILDHIVCAMRTAFPLTDSTNIVNSAVVKTLDATIKVTPAVRHLRASTVTDVPGFYFAGDWTDTGLPATMEGAVRSGNKAADLVATRL